MSRLFSNFGYLEPSINECCRPTPDRQNGRMNRLILPVGIAMCWSRPLRLSRPRCLSRQRSRLQPCFVPSSLTKHHSTALVTWKPRPCWADRLCRHWCIHRTDGHCASRWSIYPCQKVEPACVFPDARNGCLQGSTRPSRSAPNMRSNQRLAKTRASHYINGRRRPPAMKIRPTLPEGR